MITNDGLTVEQQKLVEDNIQLIKWWVYKRQRKERDTVELESIANLALFKAAATYDASKGEFRGYFYAIAENDLRLYWRAQVRVKKLKTIPLETIVCDNATLSDVIPSNINVEEKIIAIEIFEKIFTFNSRERECVLQRIQDKSEKEIGKSFGLSPSRVSRILTRVKKKLRKEYEL